jgi:drug/metabolite transporter (DMT)-like permease
MPVRQRIAYYFLCLVWGSTWLAIRVLVQNVPPFRAAALRFLLAAVVLIAWAWLRKSAWPKEEGQRNAIVVLSFTMMCIPFGLVFWAEQYVTSSMTAILFSSTPLLVSLLTPLMLRRQVPRQAVYGMVIAFGGLLVLFYSGLFNYQRAILGGIAVLLAVLLSSWSLVYAKTRIHGVDAVVSTGLQLLIGSLGLFWATWALESHQKSDWSQTAIFSLLFLAFIGSAAAFAAYYWLLKHMEPYQIATINLIVPLVAVLEGSLLLHEPVPVTMIIAMIVVLGSVSFVLRAEADSAKTTPIFSRDPE